MVKVSSWWQQLLIELERVVLILVKSLGMKPHRSNRFRGPGGWLAILTIAVAMLLWNWKLFLAISAGLLVMWGVYAIQQQDWQRYWSNWCRFFSGSNRHLSLAVGSGGFATLSTYMAVSIWSESDSAWIAVSAMMQGAAILLTLLVVVIFNLTRQGDHEQTVQDQMLQELTSDDSLKRLLAVRHLTRWGSHHPLSPSRRRQIVECFHLLLSRESESIVKDAILDGLEVFENRPIPNKKLQPLQTPLNLKPTAKIHLTR